MSNQSILDSTTLDNLPTALRQAIADAKAIEPRVNGRYAGAIDRIVRGSATLNSDGTVDVLSRTGGHVHHVGNGISCDCQDARLSYHAPVIAGKHACVHQVVAWIVIKAQRLAQAQAQAERTARDSAPVQAPKQTKWADRASKSCWYCGSTSFTDEALCGQAGRCHYCGTRMPETAAQANPPTEQAPAIPAPTVCEHMTISQLAAAASKVNGGAPYVLAPTHIGGHGYAQILQAESDPQAHEFYLICGDWHADQLFVAQWGDRWGQIDQAAMQQLFSSLTPKPAMKPVVGYYLETCSAGIKVMVTHGQGYPQCVKFVANSPDRNEQASKLVAERAAAVAAHYQATPGVEVELRRSLLPAQWRNRMGGDQIGKAWVVYAQQPLRNAA